MQRVAVCCGVLRCVVVNYTSASSDALLQCVVVCSSVLQCVAVCYIVLQ